GNAGSNPQEPHARRRWLAAGAAEARTARPDEPGGEAESGVPGPRAGDPHRNGGHQARTAAINPAWRRVRVGRVRVPFARGTTLGRSGDPHRLDNRADQELQSGGLRDRTRSRFPRSEEHTSELQSRENLVCRLLLEKKKNILTSNI